MQVVKMFGGYGTAVHESGEVIPGLQAEGDISHLKLDPIRPEIIGKIRVDLIKQDAKADYVKEACGIITDFDEFEKIRLPDPPADASRLHATKWKWVAIILALVTARVLVPEKDDRSKKSDGKNQKIKGSGGIFGVLKDLLSLRAVWNGKGCNKGYHRPKGVNICDPPRVAHILSEKFGRKKVYFVMCDFRHYFYQIPLVERISAFFGVMYRKKRPGKSTESMWYRLAVVPMGWSWAPYIAQCIGWHVVTHTPAGKRNFFKPEPNGSVGPPMFRETEGGGIVFLYYDNVHAYFSSAEEAKDFQERLRGNAALYHVECKYLDFYDLDMKPTVYPNSLGLDYTQVKVKDKRYNLGWRQTQSKIDALPQIALAELISARDVARVAGRLFYRQLLFPVIPPGNGLLLQIISRAARHQAKAGWDTKNFQLSVGERAGLEALWTELKKNEFIFNVPTTKSSRVWLASDASGKRFGYVRYKNLRSHDLPEKHPGIDPDWTVSGEFDEEDLASAIIYVKEIYAATRAIIRGAQESPGSVITIAVDNTAACYAIQRRASLNKVATRYLDEMTAALCKHQCRVIVIPIPGCYNVSDWPSRNKAIPVGEIWREKKAWKEGLMRYFDPSQKTWDVLRLGYLGSRIEVPLEEGLSRSEGEGLFHPDEGEEADCVEEENSDEEIEDPDEKELDRLLEEPEYVDCDEELSDQEAQEVLCLGSSRKRPRSPVLVDADEEQLPPEKGVVVFRGRGARTL
jgi:hypothetical protein